MPTDKLIHFLAGSTIAALAYPFGLLWSIAAVLIAAFGKEVYDSTDDRAFLDFTPASNAARNISGWFSYRIAEVP